MPSRRLKQICLATSVTATLLLPRTADAGCLDWLFGRQPTYQANYPYAAYYPAAGYPATATPVTQPYTPGVVQAQRPAVTSPTVVQRFENPSVYTGFPAGTAPVVSGQPTQFGTQSVLRLPSSGTVAPLTAAGPPSGFATTDFTQPGFAQSNLPLASTQSQPLISSNRVPIAESLRGAATTNPILTTPSYSSYYPSAVAPTSYGTPLTLNSQTQVLPTVVVPRRRFGSGLARFFNSLLGRRDTNYVTSYYAAPITYYRPYTSVDPVNGTTVTVQQPCSSYVQQLQRVPYNSFLPLQQNAVTPLQNQPPVCPPAPMIGSQSVTPGTFTPPPSSFGSQPSWEQSTPGAIGQVGGSSFPGAPGAVPIPSTIPGTEFPNTEPLTGAGDPADQQNVPQPRLESRRFEPDPPYETSPFDEEEESVEDESESNGEPGIRLFPPVDEQSQHRNDPLRRSNRFTSKSPTPIETPDPLSPPLSPLRPIGAPERGGVDTEGKANSSLRSNETPPQLPPSGRGGLFRNSESSAAMRSQSIPAVTVPVREATTRRQSIRPVAAWEETPAKPAPIKRDSGGWLPVR